VSARDDGTPLSAPPKDRFPDAVLAALRDLVERACGLVLGEAKLLHLTEAARERMKAEGVSDPWQYLLRVMQGPGSDDALKALVALLVVGETSFFRTPQQFRALQADLLPELVASGSPVPLRIWSAGCATGEEPYSIAMAVLEAFKGRFADPVRILATDIHGAFLSIARDGIYPRASEEKIPPIIAMKYFETLPDGRLRVKDDVRRLVDFEECNLAGFASAPPPQPTFHAIFCRNVMIYFRTETTRRIVARFHDALRAGGALFLGHSETLWGVSESFRLERKSGAYYYRKASGGPRPIPSDAREDPAGTARGGGETSSLGSLLASAERMADREMLEGAEKICREAVAADPECAEAIYFLGVILRRRGALDEALSWAEKAFAASPSFVMAGVEIAECLSLLGRTSESAAMWKELRLLLDGEVRLPVLLRAGGLSPKILKNYVSAKL
jgi:chemotaxis protein methyltransferase CheR